MTIAFGRRDAAAIADTTIIADLFPAGWRATAALHVFLAGRDVANDLKVIADA